MAKRAKKKKSGKKAKTAAAASNEAALWAPLSALAHDALVFWHSFLGLRMGPHNDQPLDAAALDRLGKIIRAISWVESKHGTAGANHPARDPMQCGNPGDVWWRELTGQLSPEDVLTRGPGLSNLRASQLPGSAEPEPSFPAGARVTSLANELRGHRGADYTREHSFYWSIPYLLHRTNTGGGGRTFACGDVSRARLVNGAVKYNGGGDPRYRSKIEEALTQIGDISPVNAAAAASGTAAAPAFAAPTLPLRLRDLFDEFADAQSPSRGALEIPEPDHHDDTDPAASAAAPNAAAALLAAARAAAELSGPAWVARFPGSRATADLTVDFKQAVEAFLRALAEADASVTINATFRPPERAFLMHHAFAIARLGADPKSVPAMPGVNIIWAHPTLQASRAAAEKMVQGYRMAVQAVLRSRHTERRAIDMAISWGGTLSIVDGNGQRVQIADGPQSGLNPRLHKVGRSYGVIKLVSDPPHWSDDGH